MADFNVDKLIESNSKEFAGLGFINIYFTVHCLPETPPRSDLPLPHIPLTDEQALAVSWDNYELI